MEDESKTLVGGGVECGLKGKVKTLLTVLENSYAGSPITRYFRIKGEQVLINKQMHYLSETFLLLHL